MAHPKRSDTRLRPRLVGTFLGILLCYGFLGPIAANIKKQNDEEGDYFLCLRMGLLAYMKGISPMLALEAARRAIPHHVRPTFQEMDKACRKQPGAIDSGGGRVKAKTARPIIIVRKVIASHDDEHGGAWKVAYADFVTAMMALFIVLWLLSASEKVQKAVGGYFQDPTGKGRQTGSTNAGIGETLTLNRTDMQRLKEKLEQAMHQIPSFEHLAQQVRMTITAEGLRIDLLETQRGLFFETGNPRPTEAGADLLKVAGG